MVTNFQRLGLEHLMRSFPGDIENIVECIELISEHFLLVSLAIEVLIYKFYVFFVHVTEKVWQFIGVFHVLFLDWFESFLAEVIVSTNCIEWCSLFCLYVATSVAHNDYVNDLL